MKKLLSIIIVLFITLSLFPVSNATAKSLDDFELPKLQSGYLNIHHGNEAWDDEITAYAFVDRSVCDLILESEEDDFFERYGMVSTAYKTFDIYLQIDTSVGDQNSWSYDESWDSKADTAYYSPTMARALRDSSKIVSWNMGALYHEQVMSHYKDAIVEIPHPTDANDTLLRFDLENHTVYARMRYLMIYGEGGNNTCRASEWSDVWSVGKDGSQVEPAEPTKLDAPIISELTQREEGSTSLDYIIDIPESVYDAYMYYDIVEDKFEPLYIETQLSLNGGGWLSGYTANASWLNGGWRSTSWNDSMSVQTDSIKLRVRIVSDSGLTSEWSNVLKINVSDEDPLLYGDVNCDGEVTMEDVTLFQRAIAKLTEPSEQGKINADVDGNGERNLEDVVLIQRYIAKLISVFPVEE